MTATILAMAAARASSGAEWSETLDVNANAAYDTNPQLLPGSSVADRSAQLAVDGNTSIQTERSQLTVIPRLSVIRYARESDLDIVTGSLNLNYVETLERGQWSFSALALTDSTVTSELGQSGVTNINRRHDAYTLSAGYQHAITERLSWQLQSSWQSTHYSDALQFGLTDYEYASVQLGPTWAFNERLQGSLTLGADEISPQTGPLQRDYSASLQLKRALSEQYSWRASAGEVRVDTEQASAATSSLFELGASRQGERVQWDVSARRQLLPIGLGLLARQDSATLSIAASTSERGTLTLSLNAIRSDPVTFFRQLTPEITIGFLAYSGASWGQATAQWSYQLAPRCAFTVAYSQARARNNIVPVWADGNQARLGIVWQSERL
jgi:hypothetical protein